MIETPLITNDFAGALKLVGFLVGTWLVPLATFLVIWVRKGGATAGSEAKEDVTKLGRKHDEMQKAHAEDRGKVIVLERDLELSKQDRKTIGDRQARMEGRMDAYEKQSLEQQRDILNAVTASGQAQMKAVHELEVRIARMDERANFAEQVCTGFEKLGEKIVDAMEKREEREHRERREPR